MSVEFEISGVGIAELAERYGTPLFVYDGDELGGRLLGLREQLHPRLEIFYSLKANPNISVCALLHAHGARAEVSSMAELITARRAGVAGEDIIFLGPGKSTSELAACLDEGVYTVVCESFGELKILDELARERGIEARVALRVNPSFAVKGSGLTMGGKPRQFGIDEEQLLAATDLVDRHPNLRLMGVQVYMGTRILDEEPIVENTRRIFELAERVSRRLGFPLDMVDVGGGLGVAYFDGERDLDRDLLASLLNPVIDEFAQRHPATRLVMELGRYLAATSGTYVVRVRYTKTSLGQNFAVADGGTNHHMAAVGIGSYVKRDFPIRLLNRIDEPATETWQVTGPLCTPNDVLAKKAALPPVRPGDLVGVTRSGAYGPTASPVLFLSHGYPAEVIVHCGRHYLVSERDEPADLLRRQHLHEFAPPVAVGAER
ncbi:diaminopimelate decarboxylase [Amycolatopsis mediterranei S699]|uniref:Diaminopimelate decarboxylase n=2 Tax=Amycolatopsis mediterranei TaxID=33910 RepID=A0A0H3D4B1_AMYMU|nr:type III PLP-dependent enzyme [Amycolatopsis mediterranei]ADJ45800.1 diaminopimelate decarboxylase [Amycolatopsis mediterranei U32]AEK42581.1 diaminopimelate decarboxylase [Amycolatopsis mediterranei S699]AFO77511.1 diaminopimelate decarboxylase [Amycolatopsis mediterranei S699]AGT84639.1 diaminopimelate decarboxylase [Amycolatopsis mediterranei RB]KDO05335.1 diaminopimelate decarboxylase [Amycolatopsis mediterranei]